MSGVWRAPTVDSRSEERWVVAPGDRLMGSSWSLNPTTPGGLVEIESIVADADGQVRLRVRHFGPALDRPWEALAAPMTFIAATCGPQSVTFDGEADHAGEPFHVVINFDRAGPDQP